MNDSSSLIVPILNGGTQRYANYLPDELLLEILNYIPRDAGSQSTLARFCLVSRQWYDVAIPTLYEAPHLIGHAYTLFVNTICPSINPRIKRSELAGLVKELDLSSIIHQSAKSTTARLLARTKSTLEVFIAPQAGFAINSWPSLSKCLKLRVLDLSLVSEAISYQYLNQTLRQLPELAEFYMPRCSTNYEKDVLSMRIVWPPRLQHLSLSGSVHGKFLWEMLRQPDTFPPTLHSMSILHCPGLDHSGIRPLLQNLARTLTTVELRDLPGMRQGRFNAILAWLPHLTHLTTAIEYIDEDFGYMPVAWERSPATHAHLAKPLQSLTLLTSSHRDFDPDRAFAPVDLYELIDKRFLGRLRWVTVAVSTGWGGYDEGAQLEALWELLQNELDRESWEMRRWHYEGLGGVGEGVKYKEWIEGTAVGRRMRPKLLLLKDR